MENKKQVLIIYPDMILGGSTTALLAMLQKIDYSKVRVDIQFLHNNSYRIEELPSEVNVLPDAASDILGIKTRIKKICNFVLSGKMFLAIFYTLVWKRPFGVHLKVAVNQMLARIHCEMSTEAGKEYDLVLAYLEMWPTYYAVQKVSAKRKIAWCHVDYPAARLNPELDKQFYKEMDHIYCVSSECADSFRKCFPEMQDSVGWVENLLDDVAVRRKAALPVELETEFAAYDGFRIVTVARLDRYTKGLDRIVSVCGRLKKQGLSFRWYLIGDGPDEATLRNDIAENKIMDCLYLLGSKQNPYPYMKEASLFVLASRNEGKPVTVSEAQVLHTPILVTEYASAREQVEPSGGIVVTNDEEVLFTTLQKILCNEYNLKPTQYLLATDNELYENLAF